MSYCTECRAPVLAKVYAEDDRVFMRALCDHLRDKPVPLAADYHWYMERYTRGHRRDTPRVAHPSQKGCPNDCGLCANHTNAVSLPVFSITNDCNLDCPICFTYNRPDRTYYKSLDEIKRIVEHLFRHRDRIEVINLTGGEPTLHPDFFAIIDYLSSCGIDRITVNTNGLTIARDESFCQRLKASRAQMVLSLNTFDPAKTVTLHGRDITADKRRALERFESLGIPVTLLCVALKDFNESDIADIAATWLPKPFVKNIVIQTMTFTGANGKRFAPRAHITLDEVERALATKGSFAQSDFFPLGSSHPLCYSAAYYFMPGGKPLSLTKLVDRERCIGMTEQGYLLSPDPEFGGAFLDGINRLWAEGEQESTLKALRAFFQKAYPSDRALDASERSAIAESMVKSIYIHAHMDGDNFDLGRVSRCGDIVPDESGSMIPACSYNLIYRERDERFWRP
jgi:7,8-dihydro-6-hydroxymethylpterin dimethyltransferase